VSAAERSELAGEVTGRGSGIPSRSELDPETGARPLVRTLWGGLGGYVA